MHLSIVSPVYQAENIVEKLVEEIHANVPNITDSYEIILVEDGSADNSWQRIEVICKKDKKVKGIKLSRNFGQHSAITAGLEASTGEWIIIMDCDLQDKPSEITKLYQKACEGYDIVLARRQARQDSFFKRMSSKLFYIVFAYLTETKQDPAIANFGIYHNKVIKSVLSMGDYIRVFPILVQWVGFQRIAINIEHGLREKGKSSYTTRKLFSLAGNMIISFSEKPLKIGLRLGLFIIIVSFGFGVFNLIKYYRGDILIPGYASIIISIWFLTGVLISFIGLTGLYIGRIFEKVRSRPYFIICEQKNLIPDEK